jgi:hypothetical protein
MKKGVFWALTDVVWYIFYLKVTFCLFFTYWESMNLSGDAQIGIFVWFGCLVVINVLFIIGQQVNTLTININNYSIESYLNRKIKIFIWHNFITFLCGSYFTIIGPDPNPAKWLAKFVFYFLLLSVIYWVLIKFLGRYLKAHDQK